MQIFTLAGGGAVIGATTLIIQSFQSIEDVNLAMTDFGTKGYGTLEPGSATKEESFSFTGVTQNANGTATLTGISNVGFLEPYTETSGLAKSHAGATQMVITNTSAFYNDFANKLNDETITGLWQGPSSEAARLRNIADTDTAVLEALVTFGQLGRTSFSGTVNASTIAKGIIQLPTQAQVDARTTTGSTAALLVVTPDLVRATKYIDGLISAVGTDAYAATPTPQVSALVDSLAVFIETDVGNTGPATFALGATAAKAIKKYGTKDLLTGDLAAGGKYWLVYDLSSDVWMLSTETSQQKISQISAEVYAAAGSGTDAYTATYSPAIPALTSGLRLNFKADVINVGAATFSPSGLTAKPILRPDGSALRDGDIRANSEINVEYNTTLDSWVMQTQVASVTNMIGTVLTPVVVASSTVETALLTVSIPANTLGTAGVVRARVHCSGANATAGGQTLRWKYGSTTVASLGIGGSTYSATGYIDFYLFANASASAQIAESYMSMVTAVTTVRNAVAAGTATEVSTGALNLVLTIENANSNAGDTFTMKNAVVERIS